MGVRRLTSYVKYEEILWTKIQLKDTRVIIDGLALVWYLYIDKGIDCRCGGEYSEYCEALRRFFDTLTSNGVRPFVLVDGSAYTVSNRCEDEILSSHKLSLDDCGAFVLPLMTRMAFLQQLKNLGIPFAVCDGEADQEVASLANHWNCPVISNDSDFFIFPLPAGYIPLSSLHLNNGSIVSTKLFKRHRLANHLRIHEDFLPLFASIMGNDYTEEETLAPLKRRILPSTDVIRAKTLIMALADFILRFKSTGEALQEALDLVSDVGEKESLRNELESSLSMYEIDNGCSLRGYFERDEIRTRLETRHNKTIPAYVIRSYRNGQFPVRYMGALVSCEGERILKVQVEDTDEDSASDCSLGIRLISYGIVTEGPTILEYDREGTELVMQEIVPFSGNIPGYGEIPNMKNVREIDKEQRLKLLLTVLKADTTLLKSLPENFQLFAASVRHWIFKATPCIDKIWIQALLLVHLRLFDERNVEPLNEETHEKPLRLRVNFDIKCQHSFAQWQSVMSEALILNQILITPLSTPDISTLYSGIAAQTIAYKIKGGKQAECFVKTVNLYKQLYAAVTEGWSVSSPCDELVQRTD